MTFDEALHTHIPEHMHGPMRRYIFEHLPPGHFLRSVLENNLTKAVERADRTNRSFLAEYILFLYNYAPSEAWGSPERVEAWLSLREQSSL